MAGSDAPRARSLPRGVEPGSFRDPASLVYYQSGEVRRAVSASALADFHALRATRMFADTVAAGRLIETEETSDPPPSGGWAGVLGHARVPFVSYPYEWSFSMLKDAALLQLELLDAALGEDITMKDATPYNIQWRGAHPVFIDIPSFQRLEQGEPWAGFRQFCQLFLYPLMLRAYRDVPARPWLRGSLEGISAEEMRHIVRFRDRFRAGVLLYVIMQARAERRYADADRNMRDELRAAGFRKEMILANIRRLRRVIATMQPRRRSSGWTTYASTCPHVEQDRAEKAAFVEQAVRGRRFTLAWDLGANDGFFARLIAPVAQQVVAMDHDEPVIDRLYRELRADGPANVLPLMIDLADPSPGLGWDGRERKPLHERGTPDLVLCLALMHHLVIGRTIPTARLLEWLARPGADVILEHAGWEDPMVRRLMRNKRRSEVHADYDETTFRALLKERFVVEREIALPSGHRTLFHLTRR